ncbi:hypothetical protein [Piscinibacter koreensis]|uniref:Uncharacterized protein n=1 Tax=Piscinibacter koreensis TaxID=2742824 RepID=A0A7Y6TWI4_9BURK|nr:hypothetical protein [Schlegelella koreensis]NUZ06110.1 hypothetical protein [Schlegelella koreensis]
MRMLSFFAAPGFWSRVSGRAAPVAFASDPDRIKDLLAGLRLVRELDP